MKRVPRLTRKQQLAAKHEEKVNELLATAARLIESFEPHRAQFSERLKRYVLMLVRIEGISVQTPVARGSVIYHLKHGQLEADGIPKGFELLFVVLRSFEDLIVNLKQQGIEPPDGDYAALAARMDPDCFLSGFPIDPQNPPRIPNDDSNED